MTKISGFVADATLLVDYKTRARIHGASERTTVDNVMATIAPPDQLTWSRTLCWAFNTFEPDGPPKAEIYTTFDQVRAVYANLMGAEELGGQQTPVTDIRSNWYVFGETLGTQLRNRITGEVRTLDSVVVSLFDGGQGVSAEICWFRCAAVALSQAEVTKRWSAFLSALRAQDVPALVSLMAPTVQGAVRDYFDAEPPFVAIDGRDAMRAQYEKLFKNLEVLDIALVRCAIRGWYVFAELLWTGRVRSGSEPGREVRFLSAEYMPLDSAGLFQARCGYGTEME